MADKVACSRCGFISESSDQSVVEGDFQSKSRYPSLCPACIEEIGSMLALVPRYPIPESGKDLLKGIHYYTEKDLVVFTEYYHLAKGECCENNCRHCAYGYKFKE